MDLERGTKTILMMIIVASLLLQSLPINKVAGQAEFKPTKGWGMFFDAKGDVNLTITEPGVAVRVEVPREFLDGVIARSNRQLRNDTYFIKSDISNDYYYYSIIDQSEYYPYDANSPYIIEVKKTPDFSGPNCTAVYTNFTVPRFVLLEKLKAPTMSGIYNFTVFIARNVDANNNPIFLSTPDKIFPIHVNMREDPSCISGIIFDAKAGLPILTKGIVYAVETNTGMIGRGLVNSTTGFFNITGLYKGTYQLEGSAGYFPDTGYAYATTIFPSPIIVGKGVNISISNFELNRGGIINGSITYVDMLNVPIKPLDSPYLSALGFTGLNYTVEAYDVAGKIVASRTYQSQNLQTERYSLITRNDTKYVGYPALGTGYSGFGWGTYTIKVWVYGFTFPISQVKLATITSYGQEEDVGDSKLPYGGVFSGIIRLRSGPSGNIETPREGEMSSFGTNTGKLFGGNILVELYNQEGSLRGLTVLNRTFPNGTVQYADYASGEQTILLRFYILGFSEFYNKSYSGIWTAGSYPGPSPWDYGLDQGTYYMRVSIRGYIQEGIKTFTLPKGGNTTAIIDLRRGGSTLVTIRSAVVRPGTRLPQHPETWRFFNQSASGGPSLCPYPRLRVYFYASSGAETGFAEAILRPGAFGVGNTSVTLNFTGHNWSLEEIIYRGFLPNALTADDYSVKAHTYGYIQAEDISFTITLSPFSPTHIRVSFPILLGCRIFGAATFFMNGVIVSLTEDVTVRPEVAMGGSILGTDVVDVGSGSRGVRFSTYGFLGRGHFFYVDPYGFQTKDYGLDSGSYQVFIPEFGYDRRFIQIEEISANIAELGWQTEVFFSLERLAKITGVIEGHNKDNQLVPLIWAQAATDSKISYSYDGDFYIHVPAGTYNITISCPGYNDFSRIVTGNDQISMDPIMLAQSGAPFP